MDFENCLSKIPTVKNSFYFCSLKTGSLIYCYLIFVSVLLIIFGGLLTHYDYPFFLPVIPVGYLDVIVTIIVRLVFSFVGLYAVYNENATALVVLIAFGLVDLSLYAIKFFTIYSKDFNFDGFEVIGLIIYVINLYLVLILWSYYYREIRPRQQSLVPSSSPDP